jgi:hypothetical protein
MSKHITYWFSVTATLPLADDPDDVDFYTEAQATAPQFQRYLERALFNCLKRFEAECDVELIEFAVEDDDPHGPECSCESCQHERASDTAQESER